MTAGTGVEVELAVARGETYLHKVRFRPSNILTVGTNPMTAIHLDGDGIPDFLEFLNVSPDDVLLRFTPDIQVEVLSGSQVLATRALIDGGYARPSGDAYGVILEIGGKAVIRLGPYKLMIKVDPTQVGDVLSVNTDDPDGASCARCGTKLRLILAGGGALTPCAACGTLNRVSVTSTRQQQMEDQATRLAMPAGVETDPDADAPSPNLASAGAGAAGPVDPGSSTGRGVDELPTFDAISVLKADDGPGGAADALRELGLGGDDDAGPTNLAAGVGPDEPAAPPKDIASPDGVDPGSSTGRAASDLPTFDAIAVLKEEAPAPKAGTINLAADAGGEGDATDEPLPEPPPPIADELEAAPLAAPETAPAEPPPPLPEPARPTSPKEDVSVDQTPPQTDPTDASEDFNPTTGQWEETLTIQAVKPKPRSMLPWIIVIAIAFLGIVGLGLAVFLIQFLPKMLG